MLQANAFAGVDAVIRCPNIAVMGVMITPFLLCDGRPAAPGVRRCVSGEGILTPATDSIVSNALPFVSDQPAATNAHTVHPHST